DRIHVQIKLSLPSDSGHSSENGTVLFETFSDWMQIDKYSDDKLNTNEDLQCGIE
ncbi:hypothetical protein HHI36_010339, partial [Cryptolaemus montrouzieri]